MIDHSKYRYDIKDLYLCPPCRRQYNVPRVTKESKCHISILCKKKRMQLIGKRYCGMSHKDINYHFREHSEFFHRHVYSELIERAMHPSRILQCMDSDF